VAPVSDNAAVQIPAEVRRSVALPDVVREELATHNRLLPPRWGDLALAEAVDDVATWLRSRLRRDIAPAPEEVLIARKLGRGARPLSLMGLPERLIYRAAVSLIDPAPGTQTVRSPENYDAFQRAPLAYSDCKYVLKTDVAAYYQYVDHERLVDEVVSQTGDDLAVTMAVDLLRETTGRAYGLPQLSPVSDVLAEIYIEPMRRALFRRDLPVARFADDFRIACRSYEEALLAWEWADEAARELGLVLNESKTSTPRRSRYEQSLTAVQDQERELFDELDVEDLDEPEYSEEEDEEQAHVLLDEAHFDEGDIVNGSERETDRGSVSEAQLAAAAKVFQRWVDEEEDDEIQRREAAQVTAALLRRALRVFTKAGETDALENVTAMLVYEPSLTPTIARYVRRCAAVDRAAARRALDDVCESGVLSAWQSAWVAWIAGELPRRRGGQDLAHVRWLKHQMSSPHHFVAAEAAVALARRRLVSYPDLYAMIDRLPPMHHPTIVVALGALGDEEATLQAAGSELDRLRATWALECL
jgi:reverse transcriptase-like protein